MTIETYVDALGDTYYLVHPAGISYYDQPVEVVAKASASVAYVAGDSVACRINTSSGELWQLTISPLNEVGLRQGIVTADSPAGVATISIQRVPRRVMPSAMSGSTGGGMGGDSTNSNRPATFDNQSGFSKLPLVRMVTVDKPSAETWNAISTRIYGYILAGVTLYTGSFATASAQSTYWIAGWRCLQSDPGTVVGYLHQAIFLDSVLGAFNGVNYLAKDPGSISISATASGTAPGLGVPLYVSLDRASVSIAASSTCNILLGYCVGIDTSVSPTSWAYVPENMAKCGNSDAINAALGGVDVCLMQQYTESAVRQFYGGATTGFQVLAWQLDLDGTKHVLAAPRFVAPNLTLQTEAVLQDLAYEPVLPTPFDNLRLIWSYAPFTFASSPGGLAPFISKRTDTTTPPYSGMIAYGRVKPQKYTTPGRYYSFANGTGSSGLCPLIPEHRSIPYAWKEMDGNPFTSSIFFPSSSGNSIRGAMFPSGVASSSINTLTNFEWRWEVYDFTTATWVALTAYAAGTGAGANWSANVTPPVTGVVADEVYLARLSLQLTYAFGVAPNCTFKQDFTTLGAWPFDIVESFPETDAGGAWCGHAGWVWPTEPAKPTVTWSSEPVFSLVGNTLSMTTAAPVAAVTASSKFAGAANARSGRVPAISITYDDGDSAGFPFAFPGGITVGGIAYAQSGRTPIATRLKGSWSFGDPLSMSVYPSSSGNKKITVRLYYEAYVASAYSFNAFTGQLSTAVPRVITQTFTLP